jgi:hypothetical protein
LVGFAKLLGSFYSCLDKPYDSEALALHAVLEAKNDKAYAKADRAFDKAMRGGGEGFSRGALCMALVKTKDSRATEVIVFVLGEEGVTRWALECLGKLRAREYVETIKKFLNHKNSDVRREAKKTLKKLGFPIETPPLPVHLTKNQRSLPKGFEEWSMNLDIEDLKPTLEKLAQCVEDGFGAKEIAEVIGITDEMKHNQTKSFCFPIIARNRETELWLIIF